MDKIISLASTTLLLAAICTGASATTIDFDHPTPAGVAINYINNVGSVLSALPGIHSTALQYTVSAIPGAGQALWLNGSSSVTNQGVLFNFSTLQNSIAMVGNDFGGANPQDNERVFLTVFDTAGKVLASTSVQNPYARPNLQPISLAVSGIKYAAFTYTNDTGYYSVDNVVAVPEPETWAMMVTGIGVLAAMRRRRKTALKPERCLPLSSGHTAWAVPAARPPHP